MRIIICKVEHVEEHAIKKVVYGCLRSSGLQAEEINGDVTSGDSPTLHLIYGSLALKAPETGNSDFEIIKTNLDVFEVQLYVL